MMDQARGALPFFLLLAVFPGCGKSPEGPVAPGQDDPTEYSYRIPEQVGDGWTTGSLTSVGVDSIPLFQLMNRLYGHPSHRIHAIVLIQDGVLVAEEYFAGERFVSPGVGEYTVFTRETEHFQASVSKSVTAAAVGIARDRGLLSLDAPALSFFPELADLNAGGREEITLEHLITMRSGLPWDESSYGYDDPRNDVAQLFRAADPIRFILSKAMEAPAGTLFHYNSGCTNVLGEVVRAVSGQRLDVLAASALFGPLGIEHFQWDFINGDVVFASGGLWLRPRDMAKIGELYLRDGVWGGDQVISESWISESGVSRSALSMGWAEGYGYGWWTRTYDTQAGPVDTYFAAGWGEQQIIVAPDLDLVAVFTGGSYEQAPYLSPGQIMEEYILPAVVGGGA